MNYKENDSTANMNFQETLGSIDVRGNGVVGNGCLEWNPAFDEPIMIAVGCEEINQREGVRREEESRNKAGEHSLI